MQLNGFIIYESERELRERLDMILTTKRLVLREFEEEDWQAVLAYQSHPLYLRYNPWTHRTEQDVRAFVQMFLAQREDRPRTKFQLAITLAPGGQLIGNAGIRTKTPDALEADIGYELDPTLGPRLCNRGRSSASRFRFSRVETAPRLGVVHRGKYCLRARTRKDRDATGRTPARERMDERSLVGYLVVCHP